MRSGNPALSERAFGTAVLERPAPPGGMHRVDAEAPFAARRMTVEGTVYKTILLAVIALAAAAVVWRQVDGVALSLPRVGLAFFVLLGLGIWTGLRPRVAVFTGPVYALVSGAFIGLVSAFFEQSYPGIALQAGLATIATLFAMLLAYTTRLIRATPAFIRGVVTATFGILLLYVASIGLGFLGVSMPLLHSSGPFGILLSVGIVIVAALNLVLDFHIIETAARNGAEARMEWYGAFALLVTLVWLYLELLRLIAKLRN